MKIGFEILEARPRVVFTVNRDSVCAADDLESYETSVETYSFTNPCALAEELGSGYLPSVGGTGHWWECILNGTAIAKLLYNGKAEKVGEVCYTEENSVYFKFHSSAF